MVKPFITQRARNSLTDPSSLYLTANAHFPPWTLVPALLGSFESTSSHASLPIFLVMSDSIASRHCFAYGPVSASWASLGSGIAPPAVVALQSSHGAPGLERNSQPGIAAVL